MCTDFLAISLLGNWLVYLFALRCCRETTSLLFNSHFTSCAWIKHLSAAEGGTNYMQTPESHRIKPSHGGGISSQSHGLKSPIGGENNPEVGEEPVERGQITTSNPKHSAQTRSEAATTIRANPVLRVSQRGETLLTVSLLSVRPRRARLAEQILTRDTEPCAGTGMRRYAPATREAFTCERSWGSDRFITASPGVKSLQNNWFTLTQDFRRGEAFLPQPSSALLWTEILTKKKKRKITISAETQEKLTLEKLSKVRWSSSYTHFVSTVSARLSAHSNNTNSPQVSSRHEVQTERWVTHTVCSVRLSEARIRRSGAHRLLNNSAHWSEGGEHLNRPGEWEGPRGGRGRAKPVRAPEAGCTCRKCLQQERWCSVRHRWGGREVFHHALQE